MEDTQQSIWNFDGAELYVIFTIKKKINDDLTLWNLEDAYWGLRNLRRELDAKLKRKQKQIIEQFEEEHKKEKDSQTEKQKVDGWITKLDKAKEEYNNSARDNEDKTKFYLELEEIYMNLCHLMKVHGLYFREGEDSRMAILKR